MRVAIGVGHANSSGGDAYELVKNREVVREVLRLARATKDIDIRCWTPDDGLGMYPGPLDAAAAQVRSWVAAGWQPDIVHELHHEGLGNTAVRGGFVIYPDSWGLVGRKAGGDYTDIDVYTYGPEMAKIIAKHVGNPVRASGIMSERDTGVGDDGWRLGFFGAVSDAYFRDHACVFITEAATYTNPQDRALMNAAGFATREATGIIEAYRYLMSKVGKGDTVEPKPNPTPNPGPVGSVKYPAGLDRGVASWLFGTADGYHFDERGIVSKTWVSEGARTGQFPRLVAVKEFDIRRYFQFTNGMTLMYNEKTGELMHI